MTPHPHRHLVAALAARLRGTQLYGKPLQQLGPGRRILDQLVNSLRTHTVVDGVVLGIADGSTNQPLRLSSGERVVDPRQWA